VSKIYTRRGDDGSTGLFGGPRVSKDALRVAAYGEVDELNSAIGVALEELRDPKQKEIADILDRLQSELFNLGGQLATPDAAAAPKDVPRIKMEDVTRLEAGPRSISAARSVAAPSGRRWSYRARRRCPSTPFRT